MSSFSEEYRPRRPNGDGRLSPAALEERRQLALDRLTEAFASDLITMEGYETRVSAVQTADLPEDFEAAVADLPARAAHRPGMGGKAVSGRERETAELMGRVDPRLRGEESVACVMGERVLQGDWLTGDRVGVFNLMGSTRIDLMDTALPPGRLKIDVFCVMGDIKVIVPRGLPVRVNSLPIMANSQVDRSVERHVNRGSPFVEINGLSLMGNLVVVTGN